MLGIEGGYDAVCAIQRRFRFVTLLGHWFRFSLRSILSKSLGMGVEVRVGLALY